jgi:hypothetical protein
VVRGQEEQSRAWQGGYHFQYGLAIQAIINKMVVSQSSSDSS